MGRIRTIKPEFWSDEKVGDLKRDERLLFLGLLNLADDEGVLKAAPAFIKGQIFAYDEDLTIADVRGWLENLTDCKMLIPFEHNGERFFLIRTFKSHQKINRPTPSKIPLNIIAGILNADSGITHGGLTEDSLPEGKGKEGKGNKEREIEGNGKEGNSLPDVNKELIDKIMLFFKFNEVANFDKLRDITTFLRCLMINNRDQYFADQFEAYTEYKTLNDSFVHSFKKFLGDHSLLFEDGAWNAENWIEKLKTEKSKTNGKQTSRDSGRRSNLSPTPTIGGYGKL
jgi:hypothetical protein